MVNEIGSLASLTVATQRLGASPGVTDSPPGTGGGRVIPIQQPGRSGPVASLSVYGQAAAKQAKQGEALAVVALGVRQASAVAEKADALLEKIQESLTKIVKQYPPYAGDDPERLRYLNAVSGLRKQLDALRFPPQRDESSTPPLVTYPSKGDLAVPELEPERAADEEVASVLEQVEQVREKLAARRAQMWQDVVAFVREPGEGQAEQDMQALQSYVASNPDADLGLPRGLAVGL